jgi:hypothetical protein
MKRLALGLLLWAGPDPAAHTMLIARNTMQNETDFVPFFKKQALPHSGRNARILLGCSMRAHLFIHTILKMV